MSFILEALKKSEQQRQEQSASQQARKCTLAVQSRRSERRLLPWLLTGLTPLILLGGWWLSTETPAIPPVVPSPAQEAVPALMATAPSADLPQQQAPAAEPSPVPRVYVAPPPASLETPSAKVSTATLERQQLEPIPGKERLKTDQAVAVGAVEATAQQTINSLPLESSTAQRPHYLGLSRDLRERMPPLFMSMHFYNKDPDRRLVRINDRLLREGDWVSRDLELVEITPNGVLLDFLGKSFELFSSDR